MNSNLPDEKDTNSPPENEDNREQTEKKQPSDRKTLDEIVQEFAPDGRIWPSLPDGYGDTGWEFRTVFKRTCPGRTGETELCPTTDEQLSITNPHICISARRDEFPNIDSPTAEYRKFVFPSRNEFRQWFEQ